MSGPYTPAGDLPTCLWCERQERNGCAPRVCYHLQGDPVNRAEWFARDMARYRMLRPANPYRDDACCYRCNGMGNCRDCG